MQKSKYREIDNKPIQLYFEFVTGVFCEVQNVYRKINKTAKLQSNLVYCERI